MVASGTATLETALLSVPMAIVYKVALFTYLITRSVIRIPYIRLVNVVAQDKIVPEFIQYQAKPKLIAEYLYESGCAYAEGEEMFYFHPDAFDQTKQTHPGYHFVRLARIAPLSLNGHNQWVVFEEFQ